MKDEFFDHIKHRLAETPVPDPEQAWQQMNVLLDAEEIPRRSSIRYLHWWQAAACLLIASAAWAMYYEWGAIHHWQIAGGHLSFSHPAMGSEVPGTAASGNTASASPAPGSSASGNTTSAGPALEGSAPGNTSPAGLAQAGQQSGNTALGNRVPGNRQTGVRQTGSGQGVSGFSPADNGTSDAFADRQEAGAQSSTAAASPNTLSTDNDLSMSLMDNMFVLDRPAANPLISGAKNRVTVNPAGAANALHIRNPQHLPRWSFDIGLAANTPGSFRKIDNNGQTKLEPGVYPVAFVSYRLSTRWSLGIGLSAPAPVAYSSSPTVTSLYVAADSLQNVSQTTTSQKLARLTYLDIPLMMRYQLFNHLTVEAGVQASYLLEQQNAATSTTAPVRGFIPLYATVNAYYPGNHDPTTAQVTKLDPRCLMGLNYEFHRFNAEVQYEAGLRTAVTQTDDEGNTISQRTGVVRMMIGYRLN